jgi:hypothetical protein
MRLTTGKFFFALAVDRSHLKQKVALGKMSDTWHIKPISNPTFIWGHVFRGRQNACPHCHVLLLTGEKVGFCCGQNGKYAHAIMPLPPLPEEYGAFLNDS